MTLQEFVTQVIGQEEEFAFISQDEAVEIRHYCDEGVDHFEYHYRVGDHTVDEQSGAYLMRGMDATTLHEMSQELFNLPANQVEGYVD